MSKFSTEEKVRIVLDGMRYPEGITGLCRQVGISRSAYYHWQRTLLERGKERYHHGIGDIRPIDRHEGREQEIRARREELFSSIKRNGRKPKVLTSV